MLKVSLPSSQSHPLTKVTTRFRNIEMATTLDDSHCELEIPLPKDVSEAEVEVVVELCDRRGEPDRQMKPIVVKEAAPNERRRSDADQPRASQTGKSQQSETQAKQTPARDTPKPAAKEVAK